METKQPSVHWFKTCKTDKDKAEVKKVLTDAEEAFKLLDDIINTKIKESLSTSKDDFKLPAWAEYQAFKQGQRDALKSIQRLIKND